MSLRTAKPAFGKILVLGSFLWLSTASNCALAATDKVISGQVRNDKNKPLQSVKVDLWTKDGSLSLSQRTDSQGRFEFSHKESSDCFLEVTAPRKSGLASAIIENIPGDETRSVHINLRRGFPVTGQVMGDGKGLKDVIIKVYSSEHGRSDKARVYGGGATVTKRDGSFELVLTPGEKKLVMLNKRYKQFAEHVSLPLKVFHDTALGVIDMPPPE